jgi:hypothetical protein
MTTNILRTIAVTAATIVLTILGVLAMTQPATASGADGSNLGFLTGNNVSTPISINTCGTGVGVFGGGIGTPGAC